MADKLLFFSTHLHLTLSHFVSGELSELLLVLYKENQYLNVIILKSYKQKFIILDYKKSKWVGGIGFCLHL